MIKFNLMSKFTILKAKAKFTRLFSLIIGRIYLSNLSLIAIFLSTDHNAWSVTTIKFHSYLAKELSLKTTLNILYCNTYLSYLTSVNLYSIVKP